jgi:hypothetical protein
MKVLQISAAGMIPLVNKDFVPWGKMSVSDVVLDAEFKYVSRIYLSPTPFALHQTMWKAQAKYWQKSYSSTF